MALRCVIAFALIGSAAALKAAYTSDPDSWNVPGVVNISNPMTRRLAPSVTDMNGGQYSEFRYGPPQLESEICLETSMREDMEERIKLKASSSKPLDWTAEMGKMSSWKQPDPPAFPMAAIGARRIMYAIDDMSYQLYLPLGWKNFTKRPYPVFVYLHGHPERKWSVMNAVGFTRMLARNQSTSFNTLACWCINKTKFDTEVYVDNMTSGDVNNDTKTAGTGPMANCTFADTFPGLAIIPQGWTGKPKGFWTDSKLATVKNIVKFVMEKFNGDADRVTVGGYAEGAKGAVDMVKKYPDHFASLAIADQKGVTENMTGLESIPTLVSSDDEDGLAGTDAIVKLLKNRTDPKITYYMRYAESPPSEEPLFADGYKHTADLFFRDPKTWDMVFSQGLTKCTGREIWEKSELGYVHLDCNTNPWDTWDKI